MAIDLKLIRTQANNSVQEFRDEFLSFNAKGPLMVYIPEGEFMMGSPAYEIDRAPDEGPQRRISIPRPFAIGKYPVTFDEFDLFCNIQRIAKPKQGKTSGFWREKLWGRGSQPVIHISRYYAQEYCRWLSTHTGHKYRLPSEAEWEYACRAGSSSPFYWGRTIHSGLANYNYDIVRDTYTEKNNPAPHKSTTPVGQFPPNAFGLHDMLGNVWEMCEDVYHEYENTLHNSSAYQHKSIFGQIFGNITYVIRGGSWSCSAANIRSAKRGSQFIDEMDCQTGFRVIREL